MSVAVSAELRDLFAWAAASDDRSFSVLHGWCPKGGRRDGGWGVEVYDWSTNAGGYGSDPDRETAIRQALEAWSVNAERCALEWEQLEASKKELGF